MAIHCGRRTLKAIAPFAMVLALASLAWPQATPDTHDPAVIRESAPSATAAPSDTAAALSATESGNPTAAPDATAVSSAMAVPIATAAAIAAPAPGSMDSGFSERTPRYRLCPGDQMDLKFEFTAEFDQAKVTIQPDGYVNLREIGDVHIAGLTVPEARKAVETAYSKILAKPVISVVLTDFNKPYFVATGEVGHPGKYELRADTTVVEALGIAGGLNHDSRHSEVWLFHRQADGNVQKRRLDVKRMLAKGDLNEDIRVQAGDTLYVPQNTFSKLKGVVIPTMTLAPPLPF